MIVVDEQVWSPIGTLTVAVHDDRVCLVHFGTDSAAVDAWLARWYPRELRVRRPLPSIRSQLQQYFEGDCTALDGVQVELNGTPFQQKVWRAVRALPPRPP